MGILYEGHPGASPLARVVVWWPGMDNNLDVKVKQCQQCGPPPPPGSSAAPVGMADTGLVTTSSRLHRSFPREDVHCIGGNPLKVAGGRHHSLHLL